MEFLKKVDAYLYKALKWISFICFALLLIILALNVFFRHVPILTIFPNFSMGWFDEIVEMLAAWMIFSTAAALWRNHDHFKVDLLENKLAGKKSQTVLLLLINCVSFAFLLLLSGYGMQLVIRANDWTPILGLPKRWLYFSIPFNAVIMLVYTAKDLICGVVKLASKDTAIQA